MEQMKLSMSHEINLAKRAVEESKETKLSLSNEIELAVRNEEKKKRRKQKKEKPIIQTNSNEVMEQDEILERLAEMELSLSIEIESAKKAREESEAMKNLLTEQLAMVRENIEVNKESIEVIKGSIEVNKENIEQVIGDVTLHKNDMTSMQEDIASMNNSEEAQTLAEEMKEKNLSNVVTNQDELLKKITDMESKTNSLSQYHSSFLSSVGNLNRRMDQVQRNVGFANGEVRQMSNLAEQLKYELEALKKEEANRVTRNELIALKTKVLSNKGDIRDSENTIRREMNDKPR